VIPADALPLVTNGTLDRQLFNVAMLRDQGYGTREHLPLIVQGGGPAGGGGHLVAVLDRRLGGPDPEGGRRLLAFRGQRRRP
jgi:hypothetical protein